MATVAELRDALSGLDGATSLVVNADRKLICGSTTLPIPVLPTKFEAAQDSFVRSVLENIDFDVKQIPRFDEFLNEYADPIALHRLLKTDESEHGFFTALIRHCMRDRKTLVPRLSYNERETLEMVMTTKPDAKSIESLTQVLDAAGFTSEAIGALGFVLLTWQNEDLTSKLAHGRLMADIIRTFSHDSCFIMYPDSTILEVLAPYLKDPTKLPPLYTLERCLDGIAKDLKVNMYASIVCYQESILREYVKELTEHLESPTRETEQILQKILRQRIPACYFKS